MPTSAARILGLDVARALAILGMVMVHFGPYQPDTSDPLGWAYRTSYGRASVLFVVLAGVGTTLLFRSRGTRQGWLQVAFRLVVFVPLGVLLQSLDTPVAVILHYYAAYYVLASIAAMLPTSAVVAITALWTVIGPVVYVSVYGPELASRSAEASLLNPVDLVANLVLTGFYPLITWGPSVLVGVLLGRADLRDQATRWALLIGGTVTAIAAYGASELARAISPELRDSVYLIAEGHTGAPLNVVGATAVAVAVIGACLLVAGAAPRLLWPLAAVGQMALSVYVIHIFVLALFPEWLEGRAEVVDAVRKVARFSVVTTLICLAWRWKLRYGPLEALLALPFRRAPRVSATGAAFERPTVGHGAPDRGVP